MLTRAFLCNGLAAICLRYTCATLTRILAPFSTAYLASGHSDKSIKFWDTVTEKELLTLKGNSKRYVLWSFHPMASTWFREAVTRPLKYGIPSTGPSPGSKPRGSRKNNGTQETEHITQTEEGFATGERNWRQSRPWTTRRLCADMMRLSGGDQPSAAAGCWVPSLTGAASFNRVFESRASANSATPASCFATVLCGLAVSSAYFIGCSVLSFVSPRCAPTCPYWTRKNAHSVTVSVTVF